MVQSKGTSERFAVSGGVARVSSNHVLILAEAAEVSDKIDVGRAKRALERAEQRLKHAEGEEIDEERAKRALERAKNRIEIATKDVSAVQ